MIEVINPTFCMICPQGTELCDGNLHFLLVWIFQMFYDESEKCMLRKDNLRKISGLCLLGVDLSGLQIRSVTCPKSPERLSPQAAGNQSQLWIWDAPHCSPRPGERVARGRGTG